MRETSNKELVSSFTSSATNDKGSELSSFSKTKLTTACEPETQHMTH